MFYKLFALFVLISEYPVFADTAVDHTQSVQNWKLKEVISSPVENPMSFPESIKIEFTNENEGNLIIKLLSQDTTKTYPFSKSTLKRIRSVQHYNPDNEFPNGYSLREDAVVSFSENIIAVDLIWVLLENGQITEKVMPGSYEFVLHNKTLDFKRTNSTGDDLLTFTATYSKDFH